MNDMNDGHCFDSLVHQDIEWIGEWYDHTVEIFQTPSPPPSPHLFPVT